MHQLSGLDGFRYFLPAVVPLRFWGLIVDHSKEDTVIPHHFILWPLQAKKRRRKKRKDFVTSTPCQICHVWRFCRNPTRADVMMIVTWCNLFPFMFFFPFFLFLNDVSTIKMNIWQCDHVRLKFLEDIDGERQMNRKRTEKKVLVVWWLAVCLSFWNLFGLSWNERLQGYNAEISRIFHLDVVGFWMILNGFD